MTLHEALIHKIDTKQAIVGVIGLGNVGLPLVLSFTEKRFRCIGFDTDARKIEALMRGGSYVRHVSPGRVKAAIGSGFFAVRSDFIKAWECDAILIAVPTPMGKDGKPDVRHIVASAEAIAPFLRRGKLIVVESSVHSDMLDEVVVPILERGGLKAGDDFFAAFLLRLRDPGSNNHTFESIPQMVGATSPEGLAVAEKLYRQVFMNVVSLSSTDVVGAP